MENDIDSIDFDRVDLNLMLWLRIYYLLIKELCRDEQCDAGVRVTAHRTRRA